MKQGNPIYGLACPSDALIKTTHISPNEKKCGCKSRHYAEVPFNQTTMKTAYESQIFDSVTGEPFVTQVHIQNITTGAATATEENGVFVIAADPSDILKITHIGYGEITVVASELTDKVVLNEDSEMLDEAVIEPKKKKHTGLALLGLAAVFGVIYLSADDNKKTVNA